MSKGNGKFDPAFYGSDKVQATYWKGSLTRSEAQKLFDEYGAEISALRRSLLGDFNDKGEMTVEGLVQKLFKIDVGLAYLYHKFNISPAEVGAWAETALAKGNENPGGNGTDPQPPPPTVS